ncbi:hypothetical protein B4102_3811 [Heyndrickxia sporothermodurans]|uniref:THIF-type NAD/FAD binding fold domain-containing protein n=1 Tax=Heyndrickxia sporothermodurans TaxID=46224 RepID=A0A150KN63_9BACI|nr:ThiF family adenylyltransferase [Heyndrickxia sporothermodurans]KYC91161.1 hypothetical protein B4102_3811 [Heyndrickxia sporothermodurans]
MLRFKETVIVTYNYPYCKITFGISLFEIDDPNKEHFMFFSKGKWNEDLIPNDYMDFLMSNKLVINDYDLNVPKHLERNVFFYEIKSENHDENPNDVQRKLMKIHITLIGCGGIGTVVLKNLIGLGFSTFMLIDYDSVNISNLNRQLYYSSKDVGLSKVRVLKKRILDFNPNISIDIREDKIGSSADFLRIIEKIDTDFVINAADTPSNINEILIESIKERSIPYISGSVGIETGSWGPIITTDIKYDYNKIFYSHTTQASVSPTNMIIGAFMSNDIMNYFINGRNPILYKRKIFNFTDYSVEIEG